MIVDVFIEPKNQAFRIETCWKRKIPMLFSLFINFITEF